MTGDRPRPHRLLLVGALVLLAPLIGEYLFGNIAITELPAILGLAPLYGGGAVLIREVAPNGKVFARVDIFRIENGKIAENWLVSQAEPRESANKNTMF